MDRYEEGCRHGALPGVYGIAEVPLSYFSISETEVEEGEKGTIKVTRTGSNATEQTLIHETSDGSTVTGAI